uniref:Uncharacterized protein n=1 Tax=Photinus pyralis TaxID=7054 RepID=A0A1Y1K940_PHOPY
MKLSKDDSKRQQLLKQVLDEGNFLYNSSNHIVIPHHRSHHKESTKENYIPCPFCKGFYSKRNLRNHLNLNCKSKPNHQHRIQNVQAASRATLPQIHPHASKVIREQIYPKLSNDEITRIVCNDAHIIEFVNLMAIKYSNSTHHQAMIRSILIEMKKRDDKITNILFLNRTILILL